MPDRPAFIAHWTELEAEDNSHYPGDSELMSIGAPLAEKLGLTRIGIHHERLPPGRRTSYPHAESAEEEFAFVLEGRPDVWIDGHLHPLAPGDAVGLPAGTGVCHAFLNNTADEVRLIVLGEKPKAANRIHYPLNPVHEATREDRWSDVPPRQLGPHDGIAHVASPSSAAPPPRPDFIAHWSALEADAPWCYPADTELMGFDASLGAKLGLTRIGVHQMRLPPGRRTSYPHAESAEEEFVFVIEGRPDAWIDGHLHALEPGDAVAFPAGTGVCHSFLNNTAGEVRLLVVGEAGKMDNRTSYPLNPAYEATHGPPWRWPDVPKRPRGPHDGKARVPA